MIKRRGGQFGLAALHQRPVFPENSLQHLPVNLQHPLFFLLREIPPLADQLPQLRIPFACGEPAPSEIEPHLQVPKVGLPEPSEVPRGSGPAPAQIEELPVPRVRVDAGVPVDLEKVLKQLRPLLFIQFLGRLGGQFPPAVPHRPRRHLFDLLHQHRGQVEVHLHPGVPPRHFRHVGVAPDRVEPHPRHQHLARLCVDVGRLVEMPEDDGVSHAGSPRGGRWPPPQAGSD